MTGGFPKERLNPLAPIDPRGEITSTGRDFPIMVREYDHPEEHWSPSWLVWGGLVSTAIVLAAFILLWWFGRG